MIGRPIETWLTTMLDVEVRPGTSTLAASLDTDEKGADGSEATGREKVLTELVEATSSSSRAAAAAASFGCARACVMVNEGHQEQKNRTHMRSGSSLILMTLRCLEPGTPEFCLLGPP